MHILLNIPRIDSFQLCLLISSNSQSRATLFFFRSLHLFFLNKLVLEKACLEAVHKSSSTIHLSYRSFKSLVLFLHQPPQLFYQNHHPFQMIDFLINAMIEEDKVHPSSSVICTLLLHLTELNSFHKFVFNKTDFPSTYIFGLLYIEILK